MNDLQKKLKYLNRNVELVHHRHAVQLRHMVDLRLLTLVVSENMCSQESAAPDFMDGDSTNTFMECVTLTLQPDEMIRLEVWEGDRRGQPAILLYVYTFRGDWWKYHPLADQVCNAFYNKTMEDVLELERQERDKRRRALAERVLKDIP